MISQSSYKSSGIARERDGERERVGKKDRERGGRG